MEVISVQARRFQLTLNQPEYYEELKSYLTSFKAFKFLVSCREHAPETGHEHMHVYVCFNNGTRLSQSRLKGAHLEICRGSNKQNIEYIEKGGDIVDRIGEEPHQGTTYTVCELREIKDPNNLPASQFKIWREVTLWNQSMTRAELYKPGVKIFYIWGKSGAGKTRYVWDQLKEDDRVDRVKFVNNFWTGVSYDPTIRIAWYDDFRSSDMKPSEFVNFIDYYANNMNVKGGHVLNHYDVIFITSIFDPEHIYQGSYSEEDRQQWLRRMEIVHID